MAFKKPDQGNQVTLGGYTGPTNVELDPYATHWDRFGVGGLQCYELLSERNSISENRRQPGMLVWVEETQEYYKLSFDTITWIVFIGGGGGEDKNYVHVQSMASAIWQVAHNLGKMVSVTVVDTGGNTVEGSVTHDDLNNVTIEFSAPFTGQVFCN
ncbi:MAG: hypothetical protein DRQ89_14510 [Epsilonproteobacteria bacterium]|nr:MAG: hypothetical protein DRQ89_14510 [Campylobacterota bacterium]